MRFNRACALILILAMLLSMFCPYAFAEGEGLQLAAEAASIAESVFEASPETAIEALPEASAETTAGPAIEASAVPSAESSAAPSVNPSSEPTVIPSAEATAEPGADPTAEATAVPTAESTLEPDTAPTIEPTFEPTAGPSAEPTIEPTVEPTIEPSVEPAVKPTSEPTAEPTAEPTVEPTAAPDPSIAVKIIPDVTEIILGAKEEIELPGYSLVPETAADAVEYMAEDGLSITKAGMLTAAKTGSYVLTLTAENGASAVIPVTVKKAPARVTVSADRTSLCVGESLSCTAILPENCAGSVSFSSNKEHFLRYNGDGSFTALSEGSARITAKTYNGKTSYLNIKILPAPTSLALSSAAVTLAQGEQHSLSAILNKGSKCAVVFASSDESIACVDQYGCITAMNPGSAVITASSCNGLSAECAVTVCAAPESITLTADKTVLGVKESAQLSVSFQPEGSGGSIRFVSSRPKTAKVDANGLITAVSTGSTIITATTASGAASSIEIFVKKAPSKLSITAAQTRFGIGEQFRCSAILPTNSAGSVVFSCADDSILQNNGDGSFTAMAEGKAVITATSYNGKKASLTVRVATAPESIALNTGEIILGAKDSFALTASAGTVLYESSDAGIASVSADGLVTALNPGNAVITATSYNGLSTECRVEVRPAPEQLLLNLPRSIIGVKESIPLEVTLLPEGSAASLSYSVKSKSAATVSADGIITALRESRPVITVTAHNGLQSSITLEVEKAPSRIEFDVSNKAPVIGDSFTTKITLPPYSAGATSLTTNRPDVLKIHEDGSVTVIGAGKAELTASAYNGVSSSVSFNVLPQPEEIFLPENMRMGIGTDDFIRASLPEGTAGNVIYESLNPEIIQVSAGGKMHAVTLGSAVIRATAPVSGASAECTVAVCPLPESMMLDSAAITLMLGQSAHIACSFYPEGSYSKLSYIPKHDDIVTVDASGMLSAQEPGRTIVTVKTANGLRAVAQVTVADAPKSISLSDRCVYLESGQTHALSYTLPAGTLSSVSYSSTSPEIASVDAQTGLITAHATGTACITATTLNGVHASCIVNVNMDAETEIKEDDEGLKILFMDIGRNDGILISCGGEYAFIDSGIYDYGEQAVEHMKSLGITRLKYYIGTHAHQDHVGGAGPILDAFDVDMIVAPHDYVITVMDHFCKKESEEQAVANTPVYIMTHGDQIYLGGAKLFCIGPITCIPHSYHSTAENENSLVTRLTYGESSFLLTGDANQKEMLEIESFYPGSTKVDILKNPHHNAYLPMRVLEKVAPKIVVFSTSNRARPKSKVREIFKQLGSEIYITAPAEHSHVTITTDGKKNYNVFTASTPKPK